MKVQNSNIGLYADYKLEQKRTVDESLKVWVNGQSREADIVPPNIKQRLEESLKDSLVLSTEVQARLQKDGADRTSGSKEMSGIEYELSPKDREIIDLLERFLSTLTGEKVKIIVPAKILRLDEGSMALQMPGGERVDLRDGGRGWGLEYNYQETYAEKETMYFSSQGKFKTEDGREIDFKLTLEMNREYFSSRSISIRAGEAMIDPLVVNYGGISPKLSEAKMDFDLDGDGKKDSISYLEQGSGFLALDKNDDGVINNGKELFGPSTGDGFAELAEHDSDQNGWIDENDPVFDRLRIWLITPDGKEQLVALGQLGIGAIYLGNIDTSFSLKDSNNTTQAKIQETGIFLREDGQAGTIQHIDLAI